jgi:hypothetical protein
MRRLVSIVMFVLMSAVWLAPASAAANITASAMAHNDATNTAMDMACCDKDSSEQHTRSATCAMDLQIFDRTLLDPPLVEAQVTFWPSILGLPQKQTGQLLRPPISA